MKLLEKWTHGKREIDMKGKYLFEYYTVGGSRAYDRFGNKCHIYWITWLDTGEHTSGYDSAESAMRAADRIVEKQLQRERAKK